MPHANLGEKGALRKPDIPHTHTSVTLSRLSAEVHALACFHSVRHCGVISVYITKVASTHRFTSCESNFVGRRTTQNRAMLAR